MNDVIFRSAPLTDIEIQRGGDGRTVVAYATPFGVSTEIRDHHGHYYEVIRSTSFDKTIRENFPNIRVLFNHGMTNFHTPSERYSMPIGTPLEITPDRHGLKTVTRYAETELADEVLELIRSGAVRSQSFVGRVIQSTPPRKLAGDKIPTVERSEIALRDYGPVTFPAAQGADILAVRSSLLDDPAVFLDTLTDDEKTRILQVLNESTPPPEGPDPETPDTPNPQPPDPGTGGDGGPSTVDRLRLQQAQRRRLAS